MMAKVTIIGAGAMGSALTVPLIQNGYTVNLWGTELDANIIDNLRNGMPHPKHKCNLPLGINTFYVDEIDKAMSGTDLVIMAITSDALQKIFKRIIPYLHESMIVGSVSKGFGYNKEGKIVILPEMLQETLPQKLKDNISFVVVGGPCKAVEVVKKSPTSVVYSSKNIKSAEYMQKVLRTDVYNVEINTDVRGTEICAAMKNAYSIALGMAEGFKEKIGFSHKNEKGALFTFAVREMNFFAESAGGSVESVMGLAGIGDLELTGEAGRNRRLGEIIGAGMKPRDAVKKMKDEGVTVEGYEAIKLGLNLAKQLQSEGKLNLDCMPLLSSLYDVLYNDKKCYETILEVLHKYE